MSEERKKEAQKEVQRDVPTRKDKEEDMFHLSTCGYDLEVRLYQTSEGAEIRFSMTCQSDDQLYEGTITEKNMPPKALAFYECVQFLFADMDKHKGTQNLEINKRQSLILKRTKEITEGKVIVMEFEFNSKRREFSQADTLFRLQHKMKHLQLLLKECQFDKINSRLNSHEEKINQMVLLTSQVKPYSGFLFSSTLRHPNNQISDNGKLIQYQGTAVWALHIIEGTQGLKRLKMSFKMETALPNAAIGICHVPSATKMQYKGNYYTEPPCFALRSCSNVWKNASAAGASGLIYNTAGAIIHVQLYEDKLIFTKEQEPLKAAVIPLTIPPQEWKNMAMYVSLYTNKDSILILT